jgi:hypothetical protein
MLWWRRDPRANIRHVGTVTIIDLKGHFQTLEHGRTFYRTVMTEVDAGSRLLLINCRRGDAATPSFLSGALAALKKVLPDGGNVGFVRVGRHSYLSTFMELGGMAEMFPMYRNEQAAIDRLASDRVCNQNRLDRIMED